MDSFHNSPSIDQQAENIVALAALTVEIEPYEAEIGRSAPFHIFDALYAIWEEEPNTSEFILRHRQTNKPGLLRSMEIDGCIGFWLDIPLSIDNEPNMVLRVWESENEDGSISCEWKFINPVAGNTEDHITYLRHSYPTFYEHLIAQYEITPMLPAA